MLARSGRIPSSLPLPRWVRARSRRPDAPPPPPRQRSHLSNHEQRVDRVSQQLVALENSHQFVHLLRKQNISKFDMRMAKRSLLSNPLALDNVNHLLIKEKGADSAARHRVHGQIVELLSQHRPRKYEELDVDLSMPHTWFPAARAMKRTLHLHIGPTNSGKTHTALKALSEAESGWYAGPLRLLAFEVYDSLNKNKYDNPRGTIPCNLQTGQEVESHMGARHTSSTMELCDVLEEVDVGVLDEIQMIGCPDRGWAWTRAVLGLPARDLHLCGDPSARDLLQRLCDLTGDELRVYEYQRLSPLKPMDRPVGNLSSLVSGDCIVTFRKADVYMLKRQIEEQTTHTCSVVYGSLPPETRRAQAELFNTGVNQVLVATDAVGMGLNLQIGRVILNSMRKFDGRSSRELTVGETKQIVGRAGRFSSVFAEGKAAVRRLSDVPLLHHNMAQEVDTLPRAGLLPTYDIVKKVNKQHPDLSLSELFARFEADRSSDMSLYFMCSMEVAKEVAKMLDVIPNDALQLRERWMFCSAPILINSCDHMRVLKDYAVGFTYARECRLPRWQANTVQEGSTPQTPEDLAALESVYGLLDLYAWLGNKLGEEIFVDLDEADELRAACCEYIEGGLERMGKKLPEGGPGRGRRRRHTAKGLDRSEQAGAIAGEALKRVIVQLEAARVAKGGKARPPSLPEPEHRFF